MFFKWVRDLNGQFTKDDVHMAKKHMPCSLKAVSPGKYYTDKHYCMPVKMTKIQHAASPNTHEDVDQKEYLLMLGGTTKWSKHFGRRFNWVL